MNLIEPIKTFGLTSPSRLCFSTMGEFPPVTAEQINPQPTLKDVEARFKKLIYSKIGEATNDLKRDREEGEYIFFKEEEGNLKLTETLNAIITETYEQASAYIQSICPGINQLNELHSNPLSSLLLNQRVEDIFTILVARTRTRSALERGGHDQLMKGFINRKGSDIGHSLFLVKLKEMLAEGLKLKKMLAEGSEASLFYIDLDTFKQVNDQYSHSMGDLALTHMAEQVSGTIPKPFLPVRDGGEECFMVLPNTNGKQASIIAERVRRKLESEPLYAAATITLNADGKGGYTKNETAPEVISRERFEEIKKLNNIIIKQEKGEKFESTNDKGEVIKLERRGTRIETADPRNPANHNQRLVIYKIPLTGSIGVAEIPNSDPKKIDEVIKAADDDLYKAKKDFGRNAVVWKGELIDDKKIEEFKQKAQYEPRSSMSLPAVSAVIPEDADDDVGKAE